MRLLKISSDEILRQVFDGSIPLRTLVGMKFEGTFGEYHLAGVISSVRMQEDTKIIINYRRDEPSIRYTRGVGAQFLIGGENIVSPDFILDSSHT